MNEQRAVLQIGVTYNTPTAKLDRVPRIIREVVESNDKAWFDRSRFKSYSASSLDFETVCYVIMPDYDTYTDAQQAINLELFRRFETEGIEFAYPTQTLYVRSHEPEALGPVPFGPPASG